VTSVPALVVSQNGGYCFAADADGDRILHPTWCERALLVLALTKPTPLLDQWHKAAAAVDMSHRCDIAVVEHLAAAVVVAEEEDHPNIDDGDSEKEEEVHIPVVVHRVVAVVDTDDIVLTMTKGGDCSQTLHTGRERVD
jgi:hypothetical protein